MTSDLWGDFCAESAEESAILRRLQRFTARHGAATGREIAGEIAGESGHLTVSAWIFDPENSAVLLVFGRREGAWKLPGGHVEIAGEKGAPQTAQQEAARALGRRPTTERPLLWSLAEREVPAYWNTPAHLHFELIFRFLEPVFELENSVLPRGARWFGAAEIAGLGDATLARLVAKSRDAPGCGTFWRSVLPDL